MSASMLRRYPIGDPMVTSNNAPSDGIADYDPITTYQAGDYAVVPAENAIYEALTEVTGVSPPNGALATPKTWRLWRPTNEWAMFDVQLGTFTESSEPWLTYTGTGIQFEVAPGQRVDTLAFLEIDAVSVRVEMEDIQDSIPTTLYDETFDLEGGDNTVTSWFEWFTVPLADTKGERLIVTDLPNAPDGTIRVSIEGNPARCSIVMMGLLFGLGYAQYGSSVSVRDYSVKDQDEFGRPIIRERGFSSQGTFDLVVPSGRTDSVFAVLAEYRATATLWVMTEIFDSTVIFGFYDDHEIVFADFSNTELSLDLKGLVNG